VTTASRRARRPSAPLSLSKSLLTTGGAQAKQRRSISRLHDDELSCILPVLPLKDLSQLVRCSRRFNAAAKKERSFGRHLHCFANGVPLVSSVLSHHVTSIRVWRHHGASARIMFDSLRLLRQLPSCPSW
jgi:hypothetical protein